LARVQFRKPLEDAADNTIAADAHKGKSIFRLSSHSGNQPAAQHTSCRLLTCVPISIFSGDVQGDTLKVTSIKLL